MLHLQTRSTRVLAIVGLESSTSRKCVISTLGLKVGKDHPHSGERSLQAPVCLLGDSAVLPMAPVRQTMM